MSENGLKKATKEISIKKKKIFGSGGVFSVLFCFSKEKAVTRIK